MRLLSVRLLASLPPLPGSRPAGPKLFQKPVHRTCQARQSLLQICRPLLLWRHTHRHVNCKLLQRVPQTGQAAAGIRQRNWRHWGAWCRHRRRCCRGHLWHCTTC